MDLNGWTVPVERLENSGPDKLPTYDPQLFESPDGSLAAVLHSIHEYRMGTCVARLAVFRRGSEYEPLLTAPQLWWYCDLQPPPIQWVANRIVVARTQGPREAPIVIFDFEREQFGFIHVPRGDRYDVAFVDSEFHLHVRNSDGTEFDGQRLKSAQIDWFALSKIADYELAYAESARRHGVSVKPFRAPWYRVALEGSLYLLCALPFWILRKLRV